MLHQMMDPSDPPVYRVGGLVRAAVAVTRWDGGARDHKHATDRHFIGTNHAMRAPIDSGRGRRGVDDVF